MNLFGGTFQTLERSLDFATTKNRVISDNIANVDTPNYKSKQVSFKNVLNENMNKKTEAKRTHPKHLSFSNSEGSHAIINKRRSIYNNNGNNVDIDKEMAELAKNQIYYQGLIDRINGKFGNIQTVIRGGN